jgi:hypothetical protein
MKENFLIGLYWFPVVLKLHTFALGYV